MLLLTSVVFPPMKVVVWPFVLTTVVLGPLRYLMPFLVEMAMAFVEALGVQRPQFLVVPKPITPLQSLVPLVPLMLLVEICGPLVPGVLMLTSCGARATSSAPAATRSLSSGTCGRRWTTAC